MSEGESKSTHFGYKTVEADKRLNSLPACFILLPLSTT